MSVRLRDGRVTIVMMDEAPPSLNKFYGRSHWTARKRTMERIHWAMRAALHPHTFSPWGFMHPVTIRITAYFPARPLDPDNLAAKGYIDALVSLAFLQDDTPKYVSEIRLRSRVDKVNPRTEIELWEAIDG